MAVAALTGHAEVRDGVAHREQTDDQHNDRDMQRTTEDGSATAQMFFVLSSKLRGLMATQSSDGLGLFSECVPDKLFSHCFRPLPTLNHTSIHHREKHDYHRGKLAKPQNQAALRRSERELFRVV